VNKIFKRKIGKIFPINSIFYHIFTRISFIIAFNFLKKLKETYGMPIAFMIYVIIIE